ncbi:MAG: hypothetical protein ACK58T_49165, partial [Phycisphaerae bacterium]
MLIRDRNQMLHNPGEGLSRHHELKDGEPVQYVRRLRDEVRHSEELKQELRFVQGLTISGWSCRFTNADQISDLLAATGTMVERGELTVLWHRDSVSQVNVIGRISAENVRVTVAKQRDWFGLNGTCLIGDQEIPLKEILSGVHGRSMNGLMEVAPGKWAAIAQDLRKAL